MQGTLASLARKKPTAFGWRLIPFSAWEAVQHLLPARCRLHIFAPQSQNQTFIGQKSFGNDRLFLRAEWALCLREGVEVSSGFSVVTFWYKNSGPLKASNQALHFQPYR